jgi:DNA primase
MSDYTELIRSSADIAQLAGEMTQLKRSGERLVGQCPFHKDSDPSFTVYPEGGSWYCYGCGRHGSIFDLVMAARSCDFWDAVLYLGERCGIPAPEKSDAEKAEIAVQQSCERVLDEYAEKSHQNLLKNEAVIEYLANRGITGESVKRYLLGIGVVNMDIDSMPVEISQKSGLFGHTGKPLVAGRLTIPIMRHGHVVQISGREIHGETPKYISLSAPLYPFNAQNLAGKECIIVEGCLDAIALGQAGFKAAATISTAFKRDWVDLIGKDTDVYVCYDADESGAGQAANMRNAEIIHRAGRRVYIIDLPIPFDPADFLLQKGAEEFAHLKNHAKPYVDYLIDHIPDDLNSYRKQEEANKIYNLIADLPTTMQQSYIDALAAKLGIGKMALKKEFKDFAAKRRKEEIEQPDIKSYGIRRRTKNMQYFNPAQDVVDGTLYYLVYLQLESGETTPFLITSDRKIIPYQQSELLKRDLVVEPSVAPSDMRRWSIGTDHPYNVHNYLDGKTQVDTKKLYNDIKALFERYVALPDVLYYDFLTLWTMVTYHYRLYDSFGYLYLCAMRRSGKTQTLSIISKLAFNAQKADTVSDAVIKRVCNSDSATIILDEAENLQYKNKDVPSTIFEMLNGGYKKDGSAICANKDTHVPERFATYTPKAIANTTSIQETLADRCITLYLQRAGRIVPQFADNANDALCQNLRDQLYCWTLDNIAGLEEAKAQVKKYPELEDRDWEMWMPILTLASYLDASQVVPPIEYKLKSGITRTLDALYDRMGIMAVERRNYKRTKEADEQLEPKILQAIYDYITDVNAPDEFYLQRDVINAVAEDCGLTKWGHNQLTRFLFETTQICENRETDKMKRQSFVTGTRKRELYIRIKRDRVIEKARQLFGLDVEAGKTSSAAQGSIKAIPIDQLYEDYGDDGGE